MQKNSHQSNMEGEAIESDKPTLNINVIKALEHLIKEKGGRNCKYEIQNATAKGENYIGVVYRISADVEDEKGNIKKFQCIVKVPPQSPFRRKQFFARPCFLREALAYNEFLPVIDDFQKRKGINHYEHRFHEYAQCYCALTEQLDEAIFMEDLTNYGFQLFDRFKEMDEQHVGFVMRAYAKLHGLSLAIKDQEPEKLEAFKGIIDIFEQRKEDDALAMYFEHLKDNALKSINSKEHIKYFEILKQYFSKDSFFALLLGCINSENCEPYAVVCHGDCWNNNILFLYERPGNVTDLCLIDWQLMRYASPVVDLMYFLFSCTTKEFRRKHYSDMLNIYYNELCAHLLRLGSNPNKIFPRHAFEEQLKSKGVSGLLFSMIVLPILTLKSEDMPDLEELSKRIESGHTTDLEGAGFLGSANANSFEARISDVIIDMIDFGYVPIK